MALEIFILDYRDAIYKEIQNSAQGIGEFGNSSGHICPGLCKRAFRNGSRHIFPGLWKHNMQRK
jgi:hypothetical protein